MNIANRDKDHTRNSSRHFISSYWFARLKEVSEMWLIKIENSEIDFGRFYWFFRFYKKRGACTFSWLKLFISTRSQACDALTSAIRINEAIKQIITSSFVILI